MLENSNPVMTLSFLGQKEKNDCSFLASNILFLFSNSSSYISNDGITINDFSFSTCQFFVWIGWGITVIFKIIFYWTLLYILRLKSSNMWLKSQKIFRGASPPEPPKSKFLFTDLDKRFIELENVYKLNIWLFKKKYHPISTNPKIGVRGVG